VWRCKAAARREPWHTAARPRARPCGPDLGQGGLDLGLAGPSGLLPASEVMCGVCWRSPSCSSGDVLQAASPRCGRLADLVSVGRAFWGNLREARTPGRRLRIIDGLGCADLHYPGLARCVRHGVRCRGWCVPCLEVGGRRWRLGCATPVPFVGASQGLTG
jgi:hypothetical protein